MLYFYLFFCINLTINVAHPVFLMHIQSLLSGYAPVSYVYDCCVDSRVIYSCSLGHQHCVAVCGVPFCILFSFLPCWPFCLLNSVLTCIWTQTYIFFLGAPRPHRDTDKVSHFCFPNSLSERASWHSVRLIMLKLPLSLSVFTGAVFVNDHE